MPYEKEPSMIKEEGNLDTLMSLLVSPKITEFIYPPFS